VEEFPSSLLCIRHTSHLPVHILSGRIIRHPFPGLVREPDLFEQLIPDKKNRHQVENNYKKKKVREMGTEPLNNFMIQPDDQQKKTRQCTQQNKNSEYFFYPHEY